MCVRRTTRARTAGGTIEASGSTDLGGSLHLVARVNNVAMERLALLDRLLDGQPQR